VNRSTGEPEPGETGEILPYRRNRRKPNSRPAKHDTQRMVAKGNDRLLLAKRFINFYNEGDLAACKDLLAANISPNCYIELVPLGIVVRKLSTLFALLDAVVNSFPDGLLYASDTTINHEAALHTRFKFTGVQVLDFTETLLREIVTKEESTLCFPCARPDDPSTGGRKKGSMSSVSSQDRSSPVSDMDESRSQDSSGDEEQQMSGRNVSNNSSTTSSKRGKNASSSVESEPGVYAQFCPAGSSGATALSAAVDSFQYQQVPELQMYPHGASMMMTATTAYASSVGGGIYVSNGQEGYYVQQQQQQQQSVAGVDGVEDADADGNDRFLALTRVIEQDIAEHLQQPLLLSSNQLTVVRPNSVEFVGIVELRLDLDFAVKSIVMNRSQVPS
jgi:hypothetical protein